MSGRPPWRRAAHLLVVSAAAVALAVFLGVLTYLTLSPLPDPNRWATGNTDPGESLRFYLDHPDLRWAARQVLGNLALYAPLGVLLPVAFRVTAGPLRVALAGGLLSLAIETAQGALIEGRAFDADDVILNTAGALLGYLLIGRVLARWTGRLLDG